VFDAFSQISNQSLISADIILLALYSCCSVGLSCWKFMSIIESLLRTSLKLKEVGVSAGLSCALEKLPLL
jgi:hypothetical protein